MCLEILDYSKQQFIGGNFNNQGVVAATAIQQ